MSFEAFFPDALAVFFEFLAFLDEAVIHSHHDFVHLRIRQSDPFAPETHGWMVLAHFLRAIVVAIGVDGDGYGVSTASTVGSFGILHD